MKKAGSLSAVSPDSGFLVPSLHPSAFTLYPSAFILYPLAYNFQPSAFTLSPIPFALNLQPSSFDVPRPSRDGHSPVLFQSRRFHAAAVVVLAENHLSGRGLKDACDGDVYGLRNHLLGIVHNHHRAVVEVSHALVVLLAFL